MYPFGGTGKDLDEEIALFKEKAAREESEEAGRVAREQMEADQDWPTLEEEKEALKEKEKAKRREALAEKLLEEMSVSEKIRWEKLPLEKQELEQSIRIKEAGEARQSLRYAEELKVRKQQRRTRPFMGIIRGIKSGIHGVEKSGIRGGATLGAPVTISKRFISGPPTTIGPQTMPAAGALLPPSTTPSMGLGNLRNLLIPGFKGPQPQLGALQSAVITGSAMPKEMVLPRGWTQAMGAVYQEIKENGDVDSKSNVLQDVESAKGIPRQQLGKAISKLKKIGAIAERGTSEGEPILVITGKTPPYNKR